MYYNPVDILLDTELYDDIHVSSKYANLKDDAFWGLLKVYQETVSKLMARNECRNINSSFDLYLPDRRDIHFFYKGLLSMDSVIVNDEIIEMLFYLNDFSVSTKIIKPVNDPFITAKESVAKFIRFIKINSRLFSNASISVSPSKVLDYQSKKKRTLLVNSADQNVMLDGITNNTRNIYMKSISVVPVARVGETVEGILMKDLPPKSIAGELSVRIEGCTESYVNGYQFATAETYIDSNGLEQVREGTRKFTVPDSRLKFDSWVAGVKNRTIKEHFTSLCLNLSYASEIQASLAYPCEFTNRILNSLNTNGAEKRRMLEIKTPFLHGVSPDLIANIKNDYGPSFDAYKKVLHQTAAKMQFANGRGEIEYIEREFRERVYDEGIKEVQVAMTDLRKKAIKDIFIESGLASLGFVDSKFSWLSLVPAGVQACRAATALKSEYDRIKASPSYFLFKSIRK